MTGRKIEFTVPGEPQGKARHRMTKKGHAFTPDRTKAYEGWIINNYLDQVGRVELQGPLRATIRASFPIPRRKSKAATLDMLDGKSLPTKKPDADNIAKVILDSLNKIAYKDDTQIIELLVKKDYNTDPGVHVKIEELKGGEGNK